MIVNVVFMHHSSVTLYLKSECICSGSLSAFLMEKERLTEVLDANHISNTGNI